MNKLRINNMKEFKQVIKNEPYSGKPILPISQEKDFEELYEFFKGKSVAIVSPSDTLVDKKLGKLIDSYDIVCKVGDGHLINDPEDYGKRIDVSFCGCFPSWEQNKPKYFENKNIKKIISVIKPCMNGIRDVHKRDLYGHLKKLERELSEIDFYTVGILSCLFDNETKTRATSGTFSINFLLQLNLKELGIFGFNWFKNSATYHSHYSIKKSWGGHGCSLEPEKKLLKKKIGDSKFEVKLFHTIF